MNEGLTDILCPNLIFNRSRISSEKIALIHSEVSESYEAYRQKRFDGHDGFKEELADIIIRTLHLCGVFGIEVQQEIIKKLEMNKERVWDWDKMNEEHT